MDRKNRGVKWQPGGRTWKSWRDKEEHYRRGYARYHNGSADRFGYIGARVSDSEQEPRRKYSLDGVEAKRKGLPGPRGVHCSYKHLGAHNRCAR